MYIADFKTIAEVYSANNDVRRKLFDTVEGLSSDEAGFVPDDGNWSIAYVMEHLSKVERGMMGIAARLLSKAEEAGKRSDGSANLSDNFREAIKGVDEVKLEAPDVVKPEGAQSVDDSVKMLTESREQLEAMKTTFESFDGTEFTFPHPYFGPMTAQDWLALIGGHEDRHRRQILRIKAALDGS